MEWVILMVKTIQLSDKAYYDLVEYLSFTYNEMTNILSDFDEYVKDPEKLINISKQTFNDIKKLKERVSKLQSVISELRNGVDKKEE